MRQNKNNVTKFGEMCLQVAPLFLSKVANNIVSSVAISIISKLKESWDSLQESHLLGGGPGHLHDVPQDQVVGEHPLGNGPEQRANLAEVAGGLDDHDCGTGFEIDWF